MPQSLGAYTYANNSPLANSDPTGLFGLANCDGYCTPLQHSNVIPTQGMKALGSTGNPTEPCGDTICEHGDGGHPVGTFGPFGSVSYTYNYSEQIGKITETGTPAQVMQYFEENPQTIFPFPIEGCTEFSEGEVCTLEAGPKNVGGEGKVLITMPNDTSFKFTVISGGYFDGVGSTITFSLTQKDGVLYLHQTAVAYHTKLLPLIGVEVAGYAELNWNLQAHNLRMALNVSECRPVNWGSFTDWLDLVGGNWDQFC